MLVVVRHGSTSMNDNGQGGEKLRGWKNISLSSKGQNEAMGTAKELKKLKLPVKDFHTSDLKRAVETSSEIGDELGVDFKPTDKLKDWNVGDFTGQSVEKTLPTIHGYLDNQSRPIPGGESYKSFMDRCVPFLKSLVESDDSHLVVTHNRVVTLLKALAANNGEKPDLSVLKKKGPIEPGGILMIDPDWKMSIIHDHGKSQS